MYQHPIGWWQLLSQHLQHRWPLPSFSPPTALPRLSKQSATGALQALAPTVAPRSGHPSVEESITFGDVLTTDLHRIAATRSRDESPLFFRARLVVCEESERGKWAVVPDPSYISSIDFVIAPRTRTLVPSWAWLHITTPMDIISSGF